MLSREFERISCLYASRPIYEVANCKTSRDKEDDRGRYGTSRSPGLLLSLLAPSHSEVLAALGREEEQQPAGKTAPLVFLQQPDLHSSLLRKPAVVDNAGLHSPPQTVSIPIGW